MVIELVQIRNPDWSGQQGRVGRFYGVMVSTLDSESSNPSSSLGRTLTFCFLTLLSIIALIFVFPIIDAKSHHVDTLS